MGNQRPISPTARPTKRRRLEDARPSDPDMNEYTNKDRVKKQRRGQPEVNRVRTGQSGSAYQPQSDGRSRAPAESQSQGAYCREIPGCSDQHGGRDGQNVPATRSEKDETAINSDTQAREAGKGPPKSKVSTSENFDTTKNGEPSRRKQKEGGDRARTETDAGTTGGGALPADNMDSTGNEGTRPTAHERPPDFEKWPFPGMAVNADTAHTYDAIKGTGAHNHEKAKILLKTTLDIGAWQKEATGHIDDRMVIEGIKYGFPIQYNGPPCYDNMCHPNHASATKFPESVEAYIEKELEHGALEGPFTDPPFTPWFVTSPLMTREKADTDERRVIVDLSYPNGGINEYIQPHRFNGDEATHNLPTVDSAIHSIANTCPGEITMAVIDLSRAYRHFPVSPLDWPLLGVKVGAHYFFDKRIPFGSRMSSYIMQTVAQYIVRALAVRKVVAHMYLDDIITISPTMEKARRDYESTLTLLKELGLRVAEKKLQPPSQQVRWLGIKIDIPRNELSIPSTKIAQIARCMAAASGRKHITRKHLQRVIGLANHLAKIIKAARVFICRILAALRAATSDRIVVGPHIRADLKWFNTYLKQCNGRAIIPAE